MQQEESKQEAFQFPSNGKAYPKYQKYRSRTHAHSVSIPFQRESVPKEIGWVDLSNKGKKVSIPFQRESVPKVMKEIYP